MKESPASVFYCFSRNTDHCTERVWKDEYNIFCFCIDILASLGLFLAG